MADLNDSSWSETDASNDTTPPAGWPAGMEGSQVEPTGRAMMGALKRFWDRINGTVTTTGSSNAYVYTPTNTSYPTAYVTGETYTFNANFANTGAATLNINSLGAKNIYKPGGSGITALIGGEIQSGQIVTVVYDGTEFVMTSASFVAAFSTGDVKATFKTAADAGWVMMDDGTIGNASSGGTTRANADTQALFELLWNNVSNTNCPVSGGRGTSALADFTANKTIALSKMLGRALASAGTGSGLTARNLGDTAGEETHLLTVSEMPSHAHGVNDPTHAHWTSTGSGSDGTQHDDGAGSSGAADGTPVSYSATGISIQNNGGGGAHNNIQPTSFLNFMIKL